MIYTVVGDPHAKPTNLDKIDLLFEMVESLGNPTIWLGDMLDTKELVRGKCLNNYSKRFQNSLLQHYVLVGNHDWFNLDCKEHSLETLKTLPNVKIIDGAFRKGSLLFLAYNHNASQLKEQLKGFDGKTVFCHIDISGFDYGNGLISNEGLGLEDFGDLQVVSGHYHKYQKLGNITYLGTPFSHTFGESNQEKYLGVFDSKTGSLELLTTPFPKHVTVEIDCATEVEHQANEIDYHRAILRGTQEEIDRFSKLPHVKYIEEPTTLVKASVINEAQSPELQFVKWAQEIKQFSEDVVELGLEVLSDVQ